MKYLKLNELFNLSDRKKRSVFKINMKFYIDYRTRNGYVDFVDKDGNILSLKITFYLNGDSQIKPRTAFVKFKINNSLNGKVRDIKYYLSVIDTITPYIKEYINTVKPNYFIADSGDDRKTTIYKYIFSKINLPDYSYDHDYKYANLDKVKTHL